MADDIMKMCEKEHRQHMQYGRQDGKAMKGKILTGAGLLLIAAALLLTVYNIRESDRAGAESEEMVVRMESLTAALPERLETEKKELRKRDPCTCSHLRKYKQRFRETFR